MNPGRIAAFDRLADHAEAWPRLDPPRDELPELDPRDAALARMIERQAVRRWLTLKTLLERQLTRPWAKVESPLQAALLGGAAQLFLMDRIPEHAAMDETVEWAKRRLRPGAGGMVLRLCNILGSRGSVLDLGRRCKEDGRPLPVTDPNMRRFLMSPGQAADAIDRPGTFARRGGIVDLFAVDWDRPVRIEFFGDEI